jgi:hypothetical protein
MRSLPVVPTERAACLQIAVGSTVQFFIGTASTAFDAIGAVAVGVRLVQ